MALLTVSTRARFGLVLCAALSVWAIGCTAPVATALDEPDANRVVTALDRAGVDATKEVDPNAEGKFRVLVPRDDTARALGAMQDEELPRARSKGVLDAMDKGALVPSQTAEHAELVAGLAGDLEHTLAGIDGVLYARVHLSVPTHDALRERDAREKATASVLVEHRGSTPPIAPDAVQRLVAGGVAGLNPLDVSVVFVQHASRALPASGELAHIGPIAVARSSMRPLQATIGALMVLVLIFAIATLVLYTRLSRARAEAEAPPRRA